MTYYPDLGTNSMIDSGPHVRAVGWLDDAHKFTKAEIPQKLQRKLRQYSENWITSTEALAWGLLMGVHECELCDDYRASGNFGVPSQELLFVCPEMVFHYVEIHGYRPPEVFLRALEAAPLPGTDEYTAAVEQFRQEY